MTLLKWGLIGAGDIARKRVAPALRDSLTCDLVAISRARVDLAEPFARAFGAPRWYAHWQDLLRDPEIEAVYIATPVRLHAEQTIAAAEAGKHVLCEKPMALDPHECDRMIDACNGSRVRLGIAYYRHFYPVINRIKQLILARAIGEPVLAQIDAFERFDPSPDHPRYWLVKRNEAGGGPMFDFGCHRLEVLVNIFGPVRRLAAVVANVAFEREVEDTASTLLQFESGACATLAVTHAAMEPRDTFDVYGTIGSIHVENLNHGDLTVRVGDNERIESHPPAPNLHQPLIEDFVEAVLSHRTPAVEGKMGRMVAELEDRIYKSSASATS